ncbi:MAG: hypothetical protein J6Y93_03580, partial [Treponema sp.]|nr:hypothetical protein [Treponema sp.]
KKLLLKQKNLAIMAGEYINVASAQTKNSSRLIIQSILEKTKVSPVVQSELFLEISRHAERFSQEDFNREARLYESYFQELSDNSSLLMEALAEWNSHSDSDFFSRSQTLSSQNAAELEISYLEQTPFVFVLVNSAVYARYEKEFKKQGYTLITRKTAPWYERQKYRDFFRTQNVKPEKSDADSDIRNASLKFIKENRAQISGFTLTNGIPVTVKKTPSSNTTAVMLTISGGELLFADKTPGLCSLLTNALAANMRRLIDELYSQGVLSSTVNVTARTTAEYSVLTVTCPSDQVNECLSLMSRAIIYSDISPALADGIAYDLRTQWRMQTGNPEFQLLCEAVRMMYSKPYVNLFKDKEDKPAAMEFTQISSSYPLLLDSTRFSLVIAGGTTGDESLTTALNSTFGVLGTTAQTHSTGSGVSKPSVPRKTKKVQLRHQFFTDISADKAGPRPAVLVPTTDFSDPLIYIFECPDLSSTDLALFNSLLYELQDRLQKKLPASQTVKAVPPSDDFPFAQIR